MRGEYFHVLEQYGPKNPLLGGFYFGTGMRAGLRKEWALAWEIKDSAEQAK